VSNVIDSVMGTWNYSYDTLNRLTGATGPSGTPYAGVSLGWTYDPFGNRAGETVTGTSSSPLPNPTAATYPTSGTLTNQLITATQDPAGFSYDYDGNVKSDGNINYLYDANGHICAGDLVPHPTSMMQYIYDAEGNRVAKGTISSPSPSCDSTTDGFTLTASYVVGLGGEQVSVLNGSSQWQYSNVYMGGQLLATQLAGDTVFALNDWLGTKRAVVGTSGCGSAFMSFPFGDALTAPIALNGLTACSDPSDQHFTGKERDAESGLDYFGARYYASTVGRWLSPDWSAQEDPVPYAKLDNPQTLNLYEYVGNNPLTSVDRDGHDWIERLLEESQGMVENAGFQAGMNREQQAQQNVDSGLRNRAGQPINLPAPDADHSHTLVVSMVAGQDGNAAGHVVVQIDGGAQVGFGPVTNMTNSQLLQNASVPGQVEARAPGAATLDSVTIYLTAAEASAGMGVISSRTANPGNYQVDGRSCVDFGESVVRATGASAPHDLLPRSLILDIRMQQVLSHSVQGP